MNRERWLSLEKSGESPTKEEIKEGWHYCCEWDGMLIGPKSPEWVCCLCDIKKRVENDSRKNNKNVS